MASYFPPIVDAAWNGKEEVALAGGEISFTRQPQKREDCFLCTHVRHSLMNNRAPSLARLEMHSIRPKLELFCARCVEVGTDDFERVGCNFHSNRRSRLKSP